MARGKKKEELSLEKKLEQALVPVEEQPYEVPGNWCWVRLKSINQFEGESVNPMNNADALFELYSVPSSEADYPEIVLGSEIGSTKQLVLKNDVLLCKINPRINRVWYVKKYTENCLIASSEWIVIRSEMLNQKYLMWCMRAKYFREYMLSNVSGVGGSLMRAQPKYVNMYPIPLPPLLEQKRIVERIESLFAKLDEAKEKVYKHIELYESRTTSILYKAFMGDLSCEWRIKKGKTKENWRVRRIKDVCRPRAGYAFDSKKFQDHGCQIIRMGNLYGGILDLSRSPVFISEDELDEGIIDRAKIKNGDILITLTGTKYKRDYGYAVCIENPENLYVNQRILCLTPNTDINRDYLLYYLCSNIFRDIFFSSETGGVNQGNVSSKFVENIEIQVPPIEEQLVIVTVLKNVLSKEEQAKELAERALQHIDLMKKSILAKAFRGNLGTNNPDEESAIELLKAVLMES